VILEGLCLVEEAPDLFQALLTVEQPVFALQNAETLHTVVAQLLIASHGRLESRPTERALAACLAGMETAGS
jgi:hypothetical protein